MKNKPPWKLTTLQRRELETVNGSGVLGERVGVAKRRGWSLHVSRK
jgi:hypothetical protein